MSGLVGNQRTFVGAANAPYENIIQWQRPQEESGVYCAAFRLFAAVNGVMPKQAYGRVSFGAGGGTGGDFEFDLLSGQFIMLPGHSFSLSARILDAGVSADIWAGIGLAPPAGQYTKPTYTTLGGAIGAGAESAQIPPKVFTREIIPYVYPATAQFTLQFKDAGGNVIGELPYGAGVAYAAQPIVIPRGTATFSILATNAITSHTFVEVLQ